MAAAPRSGWRLRATAAAMRASSRSVAASRSSRLRALGRECAVAADDQALAREIGRGNRRHVALVEQRHLQHAGLAQRLDRRGPQGADPIEPGRGEIGSDPRLGDEAAVPDQNHMIKTEAFFELGHLAGQRHRVCGAAREHLDGHGTAVRGAEQTVDDLQLASLAVTVVAELGQRAAPAFQIARRDVVEHQGAAGEVAFGEGRLDRRLAHREPVQSAVEFVLVDHAEAELLAQAGAGGVRRQCPGGGELGARIEQAADDESQHQVATAVALGAEQTIEANLARRAERRGDMPMRQRADNGDGLPVRRDNGAAFEQHLEAGDTILRPVRKVQQSALLDPAGFAVTLTQQDGRRRAAIGNRFDIHGNMITLHPPRYNHKMAHYMATNQMRSCQKCCNLNCLTQRKEGSSG